MKLNPYRRERIPGLVNLDVELRRELVVNGTFDSDVSNWTATSPATISWSSGTLRISRVSAAYTVDMCYQDIAVVKNIWYALFFDYVYENSSTNTLECEFSWDGGANDTNMLSVSSVKNTNCVIFKALGDSLRLIFKVGNNTTGICGMDNVSLKRVIYLE